MPGEKLIAVKEFCSYHEIDTRVIIDFNTHNLISLTREKRSYYISSKQLPIAEKLLRLHLNLGINLEGLEVILPLLERLQNQEDRLRELENLLSFYQDSLIP